MYSPQNFLPKTRQKLLRFCPRTVVSVRGSDGPPCGEGSQTGDGEYPCEGTKQAGSPQNVKTAAPETQKMMGAENIYRQEAHMAVHVALTRSFS